jgi:hypothetical protein
MSAKSPFMIQDNASKLCWTAVKPSVVPTSFRLQGCINSFPPPANQRFVTVFKYSSGSKNYTNPDNIAMTILDSSVSPTNPATWDSNSLCLTFTKNLVSTVKCGKNGTFAFGAAFRNTCYGPNAVDGKTIVAYPCPSPSTTLIVNVKV